MKNLIALVVCTALMQPVFAQWNVDKSINNIVTDTIGQKSPFVMCSDGSGGAIIAWYDTRASPFNDFHDVFVQRIDENGYLMWPRNGVSFNVSTTGFGDIDIAEDGSGGAVVTFIQGSGTTLNIYAQRVNAAGTKLWNNGNPVIVCNATGAQSVPKIAATGNQTFTITWEDERSGTGSDIYAQKLNANGLPLWTGNGVVVNAATNNQQEPQVIAIGNGEVIVCWKDLRNGVNLDIYAQRLNSSGVRQWLGLDGLLSGRVIVNSAGNQNYPKMCTDGGTGAIIAWQDFRNGGANSTDIYAQKISADGQVAWQANGVVLCNTTNSQEIQAISPTGDGGAAITWLDYVSDVLTSDIYTQKVDSTGITKWTTNGVAICVAPNQQNAVSSAPDSQGGLIVTWADNRLTVLDRTIYAQRIDSTGTPVWNKNGTLLTTAPDSKTLPAVINKGCTSVFAWSDARFSTNNVYRTDIIATSLDCSGIIQVFTVCNWTGVKSSSWNEAENWSCQQVPDETDAVVIPPSTPFNLVVENIKVACRSMRVDPSAVVQVKGSGEIRVAK